MADVLDIDEISRGLARNVRGIQIDEQLKKGNTDIDRRKSHKRVTKTSDNVGGYLNRRSWLLLLLYASIPVFGWIVIIHGIFSKKSTHDKKCFCEAYAIMKVILLCISLLLLFIGYQVVLKLIEYFLQYIA